MEKITIDMGCLNGHNSKQTALFNAIRREILELWPDIKESNTSTGCWTHTTWSNDKVLFKFNVDSSD